MEVTSTRNTDTAAPSLALSELSDWIEAQIGNWAQWAAERDPAWLSLTTGNERWPTVGHMFVHAFSPLHRYADFFAGVEAADDSHVPHDSWPELLAWARKCQSRHALVCEALTPEQAGRVRAFQTRGYGELHSTASEALTHACTHCFWHLGGIAHLLRAAGIEPPQRSDLLFWAVERHQQG